MEKRVAYDSDTCGYNLRKISRKKFNAGHEFRKSGFALHYYVELFVCKVL